MIIKKNNLKITKYIFVILIFFFLYSINLVFFPIYISQMISIAGIVYLSIYIMKRRKIIIDNNLLILFSLLFFYFLWVFYRTSVYGFVDVALFKNSILVISQSIIGALFIVLLTNKKNYTTEDLIKMIHLVIVVQALFIILTFISWDFRLFILRYIPEKGNISALHPFRVRGLTHGTGASLSAFQAIGLLFSCYLLLNYRSLKYKMFLSVSIFILICSILLTGNTGLLIIPLSGFYLINYTFFNKKISRKYIYYIVIILVVIILSSIIFISIYRVFGQRNMSWGEDVLNRVIRSVSEEYLVDGSYLPPTIRLLLAEHLFFPNDFRTFLAGNPTTFVKHRINSDMGYIRTIFGVGIIGGFLKYWIGYN